MNPNTVAEMNNIMGHLVQSEALGRLGEECLSLFCSVGDVSVSIPALGLEVVGPDAILQAALDTSSQERGRGNIHVLHSAAYRTEDDELAEGHWNTYTYSFRKADKNGRFHEVRFAYLRFHVTFRKEADQWRIWRFRSDTLLHVDPWPYDPETECAVFDHPGDESKIHLPDPFSCPDGETYVELRNLAGRYLHNGPLNAIALFNGTDAVLSVPNVLDKPAHGLDSIRESFENWEHMERENGRYLTVQMGTCPVFSTQSESRAEGCFVGYCFDIKGRLFGDLSLENRCIIRFMLLRFSFIKIDGIWYIHGVDQQDIASLEDVHTILQERRCVMMEQDNRVCVPGKCKRNAAADVFEVESILPQWTERLKRHDLTDFVPLYMNNSKRELAIVLSRGFFGQAAVEKHTNTLINVQLQNHPSMRKYPQFHTGNTPVIEISEDGAHAVAAWYDFGFGNIGVGVFYDENDRQRYYFPGIGKYYHSFVKENGQWRMYRLGWYPIMGNLNAWSYTVGETGGWASDDTDQPWPLPFEDFRD